MICLWAFFLCFCIFCCMSLAHEYMVIMYNKNVSHHFFFFFLSIPLPSVSFIYTHTKLSWRFLTAHWYLAPFFWAFLSFAVYWIMVTSLASVLSSDTSQDVLHLSDQHFQHETLAFHHLFHVSMDAFFFPLCVGILFLCKSRLAGCKTPGEAYFLVAG